MHFKKIITETRLKFLQFSFGPSTLLFLDISFFILSGQALRLDINVYDHSGAKRKVKLFCERFEGSPAFEKADKIQEMWNQSSAINLHEIVVNSSQHLKCFLLEPATVTDHKLLISRLHRELEDAIPLDKGNCPPGYRINENLCFPCFPGTYTSGQESECTLCPQNFYTDSKAASTCIPCPEGKVTLYQGSPSIDSCVFPGSSSGASPSDLTPSCVIAVIIILTFILIAWFIFLYWFLFHKKRQYHNKDPTYKDLGKVEQESGNLCDTAEDETSCSDFDSEEEEDTASGSPSAEHHVYERVSLAQNEKHIYENISPYQEVSTQKSMYEIPRTDQSSQIYTELPSPVKFLQNQNVPLSVVIQRPSQDPDDIYEVPVTVNKDNIVMQVQISPVNPLIVSSLQMQRTSHVRKNSAKITNDVMHHRSYGKRLQKSIENLVGDGPSTELLQELMKTQQSKTKSRVNSLFEPDSLEMLNHGVEKYISPLKSAYVGQDRSETSKSVRNAMKTLETGQNPHSVTKRGSDISLERLSQLNENISKILGEEPVKRVKVSRSEEVPEKNSKAKAKSNEMHSRKVKSEVRSNKFPSIVERDTQKSEIENRKMISHATITDRIDEESTES